MTKKEVAKTYLERLAAGDIAAIIALFAPDGKVQSPIYGLQSAQNFYRELAADTRESRLELLGIFETSQDNRLALYFNYHWLMANGEEVHFEVVDILQFNAQNQIEELRIIYDTAQARKKLES
ncbi:MAG: nuclear transport factor 2 family protein [Bacteroidota bacterium]